MVPFDPVWSIRYGSIERLLVKVIQLKVIEEFQSISGMAHIPDGRTHVSECMPESTLESMFDNGHSLCHIDLSLK